MLARRIWRSLPPFDLCNVASAKGAAMTRFITTAALALALSATALSPSVTQTAEQTGPMAGMMGGGCPMIGMMRQGMMGQGMMDQGMMDQGMSGHGMMRQGMLAGRQARMGAMVDGRLAYLKGELNITDAQSDAWNSYASAVKGRVDVMQGVHQAMMDAMQKGSAIGRMDARIKSMEALVEAMKAVKPATEKLYVVLTEEQKKVADQLFGMDCGAM
jgi:hypothetical protein